MQNARKNLGSAISSLGEPCSPDNVVEEDNLPPEAYLPISCLTLFYMGSRIYIATWGEVGEPPWLNAL